MVNRILHPKKFFTKEEKRRIVEAIRQAEGQTSGEIRVFVERRGHPEVLTRAKKVFQKLGMTRTQKRNGVLIYFSLSQRAFAIVGDEGIHAKVGDNFWKGIAAGMEKHFSQDDFSLGLVEGIREMGATLRRYFPRGAGDTNELSDEVAG